MSFLSGMTLGVSKYTVAYDGSPLMMANRLSQVAVTEALDPNQVEDKIYQIFK
jgi:hypothetical protein